MSQPTPKWELVLLEADGREVARLYPAANNIDPEEIIVHEGRSWRFDRDEPSGKAEAPVRMFYRPA